MTTSAESTQQALEAFNEEIQQGSLQGHWKMELPANAQPRSKLLPMHWRWSTLREYLLRSGSLITVNDAGRRTIQLLNPGLAPRKSTTHTLQMSFQLVLPGEVATAHRHNIAAIRYVVEGSNTFTTVEGDSFLMEPGDLILTPGWTWHDHMNESEEPIIWIDGLDVPLVFALDTLFIEEYSEPRQRVSKILRTSADRGTATDPSTNWYFKWKETEQALLKLAASTPATEDVVYEYRQQDGRPTLPTMLCQMQLLRPAEATGLRRHTSVGAYQVLRGHGRTTIGEGTVFEWGPGDAFVVPNWTWHRHENTSTGEDAVLFSMSDQPIFEAFGLHRSERAN
jgi:gentisate 1,2-dioxygenase